MISVLDFQPEGRWFEPGLCRRVVSLDKLSKETRCLCPPGCINEYRRHYAGGNLAMEYSGISSRRSSNTLSRSMLGKPG